MGTRLMFFVGTGEPLLHPRAFDLIETAKRNGFELVMYTNGTSLTEGTIRTLMDLRLDVLRVSLWSGTEEGFADQVGREAAPRFGDIVEGMKRLTRLKRERGARFPLLELCQSVTQHNTQDVERVVPLAQACGCDRLCFSPLVDFGEDAFRRFQPSAQDCEVLQEDLAGIIPRLAALSIESNIDTMLLHYRTGGRLWQHTPCYPAWFFSYIRSDGKVFLCQRNGKTTPALGDLRECGFPAIWNSAHYLNARRMASRCGGPATDGQYFCPFCSHSMNTHKVHRRFGPLRPALNLLRGVSN
jgi:MoaA/NifB/PqqE/SkfB family radical SAM enzyme